MIKLPKFSNRAKNSEQQTREEVLQLVEAELDRRGVPWTMEVHAEGYRLTFGPQAQMRLVNLTERLQSSNRRTWQSQVEDYVNQGLALQQQVNAHPDEAETRKRIRNRLISEADKAAEPRYSYARPFAPGVVEVLCLAYDQSAVRVYEDQLNDLPLPVDELFRQGRINTTAEPVDGIFHFDDDVSFLGGGFFTASKAANIAALIPDVIGPAPAGVLFAIPYRNVLVYTTVKSAKDADGLFQFIPITQIVEAMVGDEHFADQGGLISPDTFYWTPDGAIERIATTDMFQGELSTMIDVPPI